MPKYGGFKYGRELYGTAAPAADPAAPPPPTPTPASTPASGGSTPTTTPTVTPPQTSPGTGASGSDATLVGIPSIAYAPGIDVQPLLVDAADYGVNLLQWTAPGSRVETLRLVRNATGYATDEDDGAVLYSGAPTLTTYEDRGLLPGPEYYYSIYLQLATSTSLLPSTSTYADVAQLAGTGIAPVFFPAAIARVSAVANHGSGQQLVDSLPRMYTSPDQDSVGATDNSSQLARFLQMFGFQLDKMRTDLELTRPFQDATTVPGSMLPELLTTVGQPLEFGMGYKQSRILARNATYHYSRKGTALGVNALGKAATGLGVKARQGPNLLLNADDSSFETGVGRWIAQENCTIVIDTANANTPPTPTTPAKALPGGFTPANRAALKVTALNSGTMSIRYAGTAASDTWGVPVTPRDYYCLSAYVKDGGVSANVVLSIEFLDLQGNLVATSTQTAVTADSGSYQRLYFAGTAPLGAAFASLVASWAASGAHELHYIDDVQFEDLSVPVPNGDFELPLDSGYWTLHNPPQPPANLCTNPNGFPATTHDWSSASGYAASTITAVSSGSPIIHWLKVDWPTIGARGAAVNYTATNLNIGQRYRFSADVLVSASGADVRILETQGNGVGLVYEAETTAGVTGTEVHLSFTVTADQTTMYFGFENSTPATSGDYVLLTNVTLQNLEFTFGTSMSQDASVCVTGSKSLKLTGEVSGQDTYAVQTLDITPGVTYTVSAYLKYDNAGAPFDNRGLYVTDRTPVDPVLSGSTTDTTTLKLLAPKTGAYFGIDDNANIHLDYLITNETNAARSFDIVPFDVNFSRTGVSGSWPTANMQAVHDGGAISYDSGTATITGGRIPYVRWSTEVPGGTPDTGMPSVLGTNLFNGVTPTYAYTYPQILAGALDSYITARATDVAAWGEPMMVAFDPAADSFNLSSGSAYSILASKRTAAATATTGTEYAAAFRHVKALFDAAGATNVTWVLSLSGEPGTSISQVALNAVDYDWIAIGGTVTGNGTVANRWQSYVTRLDNGEAGAPGQTKPVMLDDWVVPQTPDLYFSSVISALQSGTLKRVRALIFNDYLTSGPASFLATVASGTAASFDAVAADPYVNQALDVYGIVNVAGTPHSNRTTQLTGTAQGWWWQQLAGHTPTSSQLEIRLYVAKGTAHWDLVQVWRQTPAPYEDGRTVDVFTFADRYNYCTNPNLETSAANWNTGLGSDATTALSGYSFATTLARSTAQHHSGSASLLVTHPTVSKSGTVTCITGLTPGEAYSVSAYVYVPTGSSQVEIETDAKPFLAAGPFSPSIASGITIVGGATAYTLSIHDSSGVTDNAFPQLADAWTRIALTFVATTTVHNIGFYALGTTAGQTFYLDDVLVENSPTVGAYFDGDSNPDCDWEGAAEGSRSNYIRQRSVRAKRLAAKVRAAIPLGLPYVVRSAWPDA